MKTIHKYVLSASENVIHTFERARFIHVANQDEKITAWAEVRTLERETTRTLHVVGTGTPIPNSVDHIRSALVADGAFVFHVYADREQLDPARPGGD